MPIASTSTGVLRAFICTMALAIGAFVSACGGSRGEEESLGELTENLCGAITLAASPSSPQAVGATVTLTSSGAACGVGETPEYRFVYTREGTATQVQIRNWGASPTTSWSTAGLPSGTYQVIVMVRAVGTTVAYQSRGYLNPSYLLGSVCNDTTSFTTSPASPQNIGTQVSLTSTATCTGGTPEFRYAYKGPANASYVFIGPFGAANQTWNTTGLTAGAYSLIVYTRAVGNLSTAESTRYANFSIGNVCPGASATASPAAPQAVGTLVTINGTASCATPQFRYSQRKQGSLAWVPLGTWGAASQPWSTVGLTSGLYQILVEARRVGNTGGAESTYIFTYALGDVCGSTTLAATPASPQVAGTAVTLTGAATCSGAGIPEYQFSYKPNGAPTYTLIRAYGAASTLWDTTGLAVGAYSLLVEARATGSTSPYESVAVAPYSIVNKSYSQVVAGVGLHVCAVVNDGTVRCWGANDAGQLGNGTVSASSSSPVVVSGLSGVTAVATGGFHSCALLSDQTVRCWGENSDAQLGNNSTTPSSVPVTVGGVTDATAIAVGTYHSCALRSTGDVVCWGSNVNLQSGSALAADFPRALVPTPAGAVTGATAIYTGGFHSCALVAGGLKCWGDNSTGQLGTAGVPEASAAALDVPGFTSGVESVGLGDTHMCAMAAGAVSCWGDNTYGQLGNGTASATPVLSPAPVAGLSLVVDVHAGFTFSCVRHSTGRVSCWGRNGEGELGDGTTTDRYTPGFVGGSLNNVSSLTTGSLSACVTVTTGGTRCWGYGASGALGNGTTGDALTPVVVTAP